MLKIEHLVKIFYPGTINEKCAIDDLSLEIHDGDFITVIGGNGAGKSTLLNLISGVYQADAGSICLDGKILRRLLSISARGIWAECFRIRCSARRPAWRFRKI